MKNLSEKQIERLQKKENTLNKEFKKIETDYKECKEASSRLKE